MSANEMRRDIERRKLNIAESLIIAGLLGMAGMIFWMRDSVLKLATVIEYQSKEMSRMNDRLADVPALEKRLTKAEIEIQNLQDREKERRDMEGLR